MRRDTKLAAIALCALATWAAPAAFAAKAEYASDREAIPIVALAGKPMTLAQVRDAIVRGGAERGWVVDEESAGRVRLRHTENKREVVLDLPYNTKTYSIKYVSSRGMKVRENREGLRKAHPSYNRWLKNLERAISIELGDPNAKEVAEIKEEPADSDE